MGDLFQNMFVDSAIAKKCACGKTKMNYLICFAIGPYLRRNYCKRSKKQCLTISFDESLNKDFQTEQMNSIVHYFSEDRVVTQYFDSQFMGHTTAGDLLKSFKCSHSKLNNRKLLRYPWMDQELIGNCYYWCVRTEREHADLPKLLNVGSCRLHVVHAALCSGCQATDWKIEGLFRTLWYLFRDSPARRDDYTTATGSTVFPLKFCATSWVKMTE